MGTRSRIYIKRYKNNDIYLWQHFDGYLEFVGKLLCLQLKKLLDKFSKETLLNLVEDIQEGNNTFYTYKFYDMIIGNTKVEFDSCDDYEYEYNINFLEEKLNVNLNETFLTSISFDEIRQGITLDQKISKE